MGKHLKRGVRQNPYVQDSLLVQVGDRNIKEDAVEIGLKKRT